MRTIKLTLAYDGTGYAGWQSQAGPPTLQDALEAAIERITGERLRVSASDRTDAGVHALGQVISFDTHSQLAPWKLERALNSELPRDMAVVAVEEARPGFHAQRHAQCKRYRYVLRDGVRHSPFDRNYCWQVFGKLDHAAMQRAAGALLGRHDFSSFETTGSPRASTVRTVFAVDVVRTPDDADRVWVEVEADGFLYNMVRSIVGTLIRVGNGMKPESWPGEVLAACDRQRAGRTAPAKGLFLLWVKYGNEPSDRAGEDGTESHDDE